jgi:hypothetical protein
MLLGDNGDYLRRRSSRPSTLNVLLPSTRGARPAFCRSDVDQNPEPNERMTDHATTKRTVDSASCAERVAASGSGVLRQQLIRQLLFYDF